MERVWDEMDHRLKAKGQIGDQHLKGLLEDCWTAILGTTLKLTGRRPRVCKQDPKQRVGVLKKLQYARIRDFVASGENLQGK